MDKGSLKIFAIEARRDLMEKVKARLDFLGITSKGVDKKGLNFLSGNVLEIGDNRYKKSSYEDLVKKYESIGYEQLIEESAYIWFNRLVALAYMEANGYIDEKMIFSNGSKIESGIIDDYYEADFFENMSKDEQERIHNLRDKHKTEDMYTMLIEEKCNELHKIMPFMFDKKGGYSDILFPAGLFTLNSVLVRLREEFEKAKEKNEEGEDIIPVEIIGWLYQYYNSELKDLVFEGLKKNQKITKEKIAPATQLFTPHWIVKYMAENSLGKLAIENLKVSPELKRNWKYYIDSEIDNSSERLNVEDIKIIDPSMGSGHMLTYSFDMLYEIYEDLGWSRKDAVLSILKNNLYGLEIDKRAGQLASFAMIMKGREKFPRLLKVLERLEDEEKFDLNTLWIDESNDISQEMRKLINSNSLKNLEILIDNFTDAKEYGSILKLTSLDIAQAKEELERLIEIYKRQGQLILLSTSNQLDFSVVDINFEKECRITKKLIQQQKIMTDTYDIAITNPPYMGGKGFDSKLKKYVETYYKDSKADLFAVFMERCGELTKRDRYTSMITMHRNEEELNKIFIDIYELNDEMDNSVPFEDITLLKKEAEIEEILIPAQHIADIEEKEKTSEGYLYNRGVKLKFDKLELVKQFLSYAVGCIMGRYSIDKKGLIIANSDDVLETDKNSIYIKDENGEIRHHIENPRFIPDSYGIIPITSEKVFDNDIVTKVIEFVEALYGKENLEKNLEFICNALGRKGDEKYDTTLRNYFIKDFYTDHLQRYQKRPIYWLKNSGKKNGFSALIYLHRYEKNSVARVRTEYLLPYQDKLENLRAYYERITFDDDASAKEKKQAEKALKELDAMLKELRDYANEVKHIAELKIDLDLDDGVKVNYEKFGKVLKKI